MKFKLTDLTGFSDVGTIVYYRKRVFYPELSEVSNPESLLQLGATRNYLFLTSGISEYTDFAKTGFSLTSEDQEYQRNLIPNLYDYENTLEIAGTPYFDDLVSVAFPGVTQTERPQGKHFFGKLTSPDKTPYLVNLPKGVWKVEAYNSRISGNCEEDLFIDYDILEKLGPEILQEYGLSILEKPILTIYFGPSYDVGIQNFTFSELEDFPLYLSRYTLDGNLFLGEDEYQRFSETMSKREYVESYREEIESEKMLYIVNTPDGKIEDINFYSIAYPTSRNPHPHRDEVILRNDHLWESDFHVSESPIPGIVIDSRSDTLLGLKTLTEEESSWYQGSLVNHQGYSRSGSSKRVRVNGRTWERAIPSEVFGENPEISPWWYCPNDLKESDFRYYYITAQGKGVVNPQGMIYLKSGNPLKLSITPSPGYRFSKFLNVMRSDITEDEDGNFLINTSRYDRGYRFDVLFAEILYTLNLQINCLKDYPGNNGLSNTYNLMDLGGTNNYNPLSKTGIRVLYSFETGESGEYGAPDDPYNKRNPLKVSDTKDLYFRLDLENSHYELSGDLRYNDGSKIEKSGDWYVLRVSNFPKFGNKDSIIPIGDIVSKKYTVTIKTTSGIQISTPKKNTMEYHNIDPNSSSPTPRPFITKMLLGPENTIEVWKNGVLVGKGYEDWEFTEGDDGVWTFQIPLIENNYEIIVK